MPEVSMNPVPFEVTMTPLAVSVTLQDVVPPGENSVLRWGNILGDIEDQIDLIEALESINLTWNNISGITFNEGDIIQYKSGVLTNRTPEQLKLDLLLTKSDVGLTNVQNIDTSITTNITEGSNLFFTANRVRDTLLTGLSTNNTLISNTDTVINAFGKLQGQINNRLINTNNLSDLTDIGAARTNLGLGTLATQNGTSSGTNTGDVSIGTANGLSLNSQILSLQLASNSTTGALNNTDWNTFNNKQDAIAYTPENVDNKQSDLTASTTKYPTVNAVNAGLATKENSINLGTTAQYFRGDKTWQTLDKIAVGLSNVPNLDTTGKLNSGATLPVSPSVGELFLHIPTGRKWLMEYDGSEWNALYSYGACTIFMDDSVNGSSDWNNGYSSETAWNIVTMLPKLPLDRKGTITINLTARSFNVGDKLIFPQGMTGAGSVILVGSTSSRGTVTYSSGSSPFQTITATSSVPVGTTEGDILVYSSGGTQPLLNSALYLGELVDCWCILSASGTSLQLAGGICSENAPTSGTTWDVLTRNTTITLSSSSAIQFQSPGIEFRYINFVVTDAGFTQSCRFPSQVTGCKFTFTGTGRLKGWNLGYFLGCHFTRTDNSSRWLIGCIGNVPRYLLRSLIKSTSTNTPASAELLTLAGWSGNNYLELGGSRLWHTNSGARIGQVFQNAHLRCDPDTGIGVNSYTVVGGGTAPNWNASSLSLVTKTSAITQSGTSGAVCLVDATSITTTT